MVKSKPGTTSRQLVGDNITATAAKVAFICPCLSCCGWQGTVQCPVLFSKGAVCALLWSMGSRQHVCVRYSTIFCYGAVPLAALWTPLALFLRFANWYSCCCFCALFCSRRHLTSQSFCQLPLTLLEFHGGSAYVRWLAVLTSISDATTNWAGSGLQRSRGRPQVPHSCTVCVQAVSARVKPLCGPID